MKEGAAMKKTFWAPPMLMLMVLCSFFFAFKPAAAQTDTTVYFSPDPATVYLNGTNSQVVDLMIADAVDLNSFDIILDYDASVATIQSWAHGGFFENLQCIRQEDNPGLLRIVCVQTASTPKSDDGSVLKLTFTGLNPGTTPITFTQARFSNKDSQPVWPAVTNGTLNAVYDPAIIKPTTLSGSFELQGRADRGGIPVSLSVGQYVGQGPYTAATTNVSGDNLAFTNVAMDVYTVSTAQAGYLNISPDMGRQIALLASGNVLPPLRLLAGNAVWTGHATSNDQIDIYDVSLVSGEIGKTVFIADADINGDGKVDIFDLALAAGNFGMNSVDAYADWLP
jgi:hypothetical protein